MRKNVCAAKNCDDVIGQDKVLCTMHWAFLPSEIQDELIAHYTIGQVADRRRIKKKFRVALARARVVLHQDEERYD